MHTEAIFTLTQWLSPAYPVGAFAYSHGIEAAVDKGWITDADGLEAWLDDILTIGTGQSDAIFLAAAYHADTLEQLIEINQTAMAFAASKERLLETQQQGWAFGQVTSALWGQDVKGLVYPVALGAAAKQEDVPLELTLTIYLQSVVSNLVATGQRLLPLGQTRAQEIVKTLTRKCARIAQDSSHGDLGRLISNTFLSDIASMQHETQYSRIFRT